MRVAHITWNGGIGGIERLLYWTAKEMIRRDTVEIGVVFGQPGGFFYEKISDLGISIFSPDLRHGASLRNLRPLRNFLRDYDILHYHSFTPGLCLAGRLEEKPCFFTDHNTIKICMSERLKKKLLRGLQSWYLRHWTQRIIAVSNYTRECAIERYHIDPAKTIVIPNGIDWGEWEVENNQRPNESRAMHLVEPVIGFVGIFKEVKRIDRLISTFKIFQKIWSKKEATLLLVGDGPERPRIERIVNEEHLTDSVVITGLCANVGNFYRLMNLFVLPSQGETFGIVLLEAIRYGVPVFLFDDEGGLLEYFLAHNIGNIAADEREMAEMWVKVLEDDNRRESSVEKAQQVVQKEFSIEKMVQQLLDVYHQTT